MGAGRQLVLWLLAAAAASTLLVLVLRWERGHTARWNLVLLGSPPAGAMLFQQKGCGHCHAVNGSGGRSAPDLGSGLPGGPGRIVTAMWNHAPRMWEGMQAERLTPPTFGHEEMADVFAYLDAARYTGRLGDAERGREVFTGKGCATCHAPAGSPAGSATGVAGLVAADDPATWAQAMWNHAGEAGPRPRPRFEEGEMAHVLAFVQRERGGGWRAGTLLGADPDRGWALFKEKSCAACHSIKDEAGQVGPELGPGRDLPLTVVGLSGSMWNHFPEMWRAMEERGFPRPTFVGSQMADLVAFLYSSRYREPGGSPRMGEVLFAGRGCARCHGASAQGTGEGPGLRGRGRAFTSITLAAALWRHGPRMYERARQRKLPWPTFAEGDVGDLMAFLNTSSED